MTCDLGLGIAMAIGYVLGIITNKIWNYKVLEEDEQ
jgi:hypothetical protein